MTLNVKEFAKEEKVEICGKEYVQKEIRIGKNVPAGFMLEINKWEKNVPAGFC